MLAWERFYTSIWFWRSYAVSCSAFIKMQVLSRCVLKKPRWICWQVVWQNPSHPGVENWTHLFWIIPAHFLVPVVSTVHALIISSNMQCLKFSWAAINGDWQEFELLSLLFHSPLSSPNPLRVFVKLCDFTIITQLPRAVLCQTSLPFNYCPSSLENLKLIPASEKPQKPSITAQRLRQTVYFWSISVCFWKRRFFFFFVGFLFSCGEGGGWLFLWLDVTLDSSGMIQLRWNLVLSFVRQILISKEKHIPEITQLLLQLLLFLSSWLRSKFSMKKAVKCGSSWSSHNLWSGFIFLWLFRAVVALFHVILWLLPRQNKLF